MVFQGSRYAGVEVVNPPDISGERHPALALRKLAETPGVLEHVVSDGDRLDLLAHRFYGDPTKYWLILDANPDVLNPFQLLQAGRRILIPADRL
jgi:nucleoid-associated protein YgaU